MAITMRSSTPLVNALAPGAGTQADRMAVLDDPAEWAAFSQPFPGTLGAAGKPACQLSHVALSGMHCAACALTVEQALLAVPGVHSAQVNGATHRAAVVWAPGVVKPSQWLAALANAGYPAVPALDASVREQRQREQRAMVWRWLVAAFCMMQVMMYAMPAYVAGPGDITPDVAQLLRWASWVLTLPVMAFCCGPFFGQAWRDVRARRISMDLPAALGMAMTFVISTAATFDPGGLLGHEVYFDSLAMFVFFLLTGRWLELRLRDRVAGSLDALMNRLPQTVARQVPSTGLDNTAPATERVSIRRLAVGDILHILPGEAFPVDGTVLQGHTQADEALLTGESRPVPRSAGDAVLAGSYNLSAAVQVRADRLGQDTRYAQIVQLMEQASVQRPRLVQLADRVARPFLWGVLALAALAAVLWWPEGPGPALMVAVAVLVVTCPCALSLAAPAALLASAGTLARQGVLLRRLQALEALAKADTVVFDKTGTLTQDGMAVVAVHVREGMDAAQAQAMAGALAAHSLHPASRAIVAAAALQQLDGEARWAADDTEEAVGQGLRGQVRRIDSVCSAGHTLRLGSVRLCGLDLPAADLPQVHLSNAQGWLASFDLSEDLRPDAHAAVQALRAAGLQVHLLSGDRLLSAQRVGQALAIEHVRGDCSPDDKLQHLRALQQQGHTVVMVGDGLNDGPVLAGADASFAFGNAAPLAQRYADCVVTAAALMRVPQTILLARRTLATVRQNLLWAALYNLACVPLALAGYLPAWLAGLGMALSSLAVVLNAARLARPLPPLGVV